MFSIVISEIVQPNEFSKLNWIAGISLEFLRLFLFPILHVCN